jgi:hypothetical protein
MLLGSASHPTLNETVRMQQDVCVQNDNYDLTVHQAMGRKETDGVCSSMKLRSCIACKERACED